MIHFLFFFQVKFVFFIFAVSIGSVICERGCPGDDYCCVRLEDTIEGTCEATGYVPGGNKVILEPIEAPEAVLQGKHLTKCKL